MTLDVATEYTKSYSRRICEWWFLFTRQLLIFYRSDTVTTRRLSTYELRFSSSPDFRRIFRQFRSSLLGRRGWVYPSSRWLHTDLSDLGKSQVSRALWNPQDWRQISLFPIRWRISRGLSWLFSPLTCSWFRWCISSGLSRCRRTIVPKHEFVLGVPGSLAASHHGKNVGLVDHLDDADAWAELSRNDQFDFLIEFEDFEAFLGADGEVGLILVKTNVDDLLLLLLHLINRRTIGISPQL